LIRRMTEQEVERGVAGEGGRGLLLQGEARKRGGADALEGVLRDAVFRDALDFREEFAAREVRLIRCGGEVEGEMKVEALRSRTLPAVP